MQLHKLLFISIPLFYGLSSFAQSSAEEVTRVLEGPHGRAWNYKGTVTTLGNGCKNGKVLVFEKDSVTEKICDAGAGKWIKNRYPYRLVKRNDYSWKLEYNKQLYYLDIRKKGDATELALSSVGVGLKEDIYIYE